MITKEQFIEWGKDLLIPESRYNPSQHYNVPYETYLKNNLDSLERAYRANCEQLSDKISDIVKGALVEPDVSNLSQNDWVKEFNARIRHKEHARVVLDKAQKAYDDACKAVKDMEIQKYWAGYVFNDSPFKKELLDITIDKQEAYLDLKGQFTIHIFRWQLKDFLLKNEKL